jgi:hypothetical protein
MQRSHRVPETLQTFQHDLALLGALIESPAPERLKKCDEYRNTLYRDDGCKAWNIGWSVLLSKSLSISQTNCTDGLTGSTYLLSEDVRRRQSS